MAGRGGGITTVVTTVENVGVGITRWYFDKPVDGALAGFNLQTLDALSPGNYQDAINVTQISPGIFEVEYANETDGGWRIQLDPQLRIGATPVLITFPVAGSMA